MSTSPCRSVCRGGCHRLAASRTNAPRRFVQGLVELMKRAFPPENFGRVSRPVTPKFASPQLAAEHVVELEAGEDGAAKTADVAQEDGEKGEAAALSAVALPAAQPPLIELDAIAMSTGEFPGGKPLVWLAQYLRARNKKNIRETAEANLYAALDLAGRDAETLQEHYTNMFAAVRHLLWPCSAYISRKRVVSRELPRPPEEPKPVDEDVELSAEGGEDETPIPPAPVEYEQVALLEYVATSHPMGADAIDGWALEYETHGVTGRVMDGEPLLVPDVESEPGMHWFATKPSRLMGSYYAQPLLDAQGAVWGVLCVDTILDGRVLTGADTEKLTKIVARANPVLVDVLAKIPPTPEPEPEEVVAEQEGDGEDAGGKEAA